MLCKKNVWLVLMLLVGAKVKTSDGNDIVYTTPQLKNDLWVIRAELDDEVVGKIKYYDNSSCEYADFKDEHCFIEELSVKNADKVVIAGLLKESFYDMQIRNWPKIVVAQFVHKLVGLYEELGFVRINPEQLTEYSPRTNPFLKIDRTVFDNAKVDSKPVLLAALKYKK